MNRHRDQMLLEPPQEQLQGQLLQQHGWEQSQYSHKAAQMSLFTKHAALKTPI